jgi:hypothetical protein
MPYRIPDVPAELPDPEHTAMATLASRTRRIRRAAAVGSIALGLAFAIRLYDVLWDYWAARGGVPLKMIAITSVMLGFCPMLVAAPALSRVLIRVRRGAWLDQLAKNHGLDRAQLDESTRSFSD